MRRSITTLVLIAFIATGVLGGVLALPQKAQAQWATTETGAGYWTGQTVKMEWYQTLMVSGMQAVMNTITMVAQQFAYDLAVGLASGAKGQNPLAFLEEPGVYFTQMGLDAAGNLIGELNEDWSALGLDLCQPRLPNIQLNIQLGLAEKFQRPKPKCEWSAIANNWESFAQEVSDPAAVLKHLSLSFKPGATDLSQAQIAFEAASEKKAAAEKSAEAKRAEGQGIRPVEDIISGNVQTPAQYTKQQFAEMAAKSTGEDEKETAKTGALVTAVMGQDAWLAMSNTVLSTFANTLSARLLKMGMEGLFNLLAPSPPDLKSFIGAQPGGTSGAEGAKVAYEGIKVPIMQTTSYDVLTELSSCPKTKPDTAGLMQCVIDEQFAQAVREADRGNPLSVKEALDPKTGGYLDRNKPFGFLDSTADPPVEPDYQTGYGYSNLKKLRFARIIPIGWELAALKIRELALSGKAAKNVFTLGDVYDGFSLVGTDGKCGTNDKGESPFCGLMDPNWILKSPLAQCGAKVFSSLSDGAGGRQEVCADLKNCLVEDGKGGCKSYGYCTREKNVWRIDGDSCEPQFASCETYKGIENKKELSLLETTLDFGACNADNAGCKWYSHSQSIQPGVQALAWSEIDRVYLDGDTQKCKATDAGCTEFIPNSHENLIVNPSFEKDEDNNGVPDDWQVAVTNVSKDGTQSFVGQIAVNPQAVILNKRIPIQSTLSYAISGYAKGNDNNETFVSAAFYENENDKNSITGLTQTLSCPVSISGNAYWLNIKPSTSFQRYQCSFIAPNKAAWVEITLGFNSGGATSFYWDALQLEPGTAATDFKEGYGSPPPQTTYLKKPPAWLGCDGEEGEPAECAQYARVCRPEEVGCERYTPVTGDPAIPGIVSDLDKCPSECVGYASYKQEASDFEPQSFPNYLIPSQVTACAIANVGCTEFTNITSEKLAYFSKLRACQKPTGAAAAGGGNDDGTYYTWEGAEKQGYQLRTWLLKQSNFDIKPPPAGASDAANKLAPNPLPGQLAKPPCTNIDVLSDPPTCKDDANNQAVCTAADVGVNGDCRAFYDKNGNIFYRLYSKTVTVTSYCEKYRITSSGLTLNQLSCEKYGGDWDGSECLGDTDKSGVIDSDEHYNNFDQAMCFWGHGSWDAQKNECLYAGYAAESTSCPATAKSCRLFTGNAGANVQTILGPEDFETGDSDWKDGSPSAEATSLGGHSLKILNNKSATRLLSALSKDTNYILSFWTKGELATGGKVQGAIQPYLDGDNIDQTNFIDQPKQLSVDWQLLNFGPLHLGIDVANPVVGLKVTGGAVFVDNLILRRVQEQLPLLKNSIKIPLSCDSLPGGPPAGGGGGILPQAMLGCAEYKDRADTSQYLKSFSSFCRDQSVGCQDLVDTYNSGAMEAKDWNIGNTGVCRGAPGNCQLTINGVQTSVCTVSAGQTSCDYGPTKVGTPSDLPIDNLTVPRDKHVYLVVDDKKKCQAENRGCEAVGYKNPETGAWSVEYLKNNPDQYEKTMCKYEEENCASWTTGATTTYFKDPTTNLCEWQTNVAIGSVNYSGWFKKGKEKPEPCYGALDANGNIDFTSTYLIGGTVFGIWRNDDASYFGQAGACPKKQAGCTEFVDPFDTSKYEKGQPYYYLDNNQIDRKTCNGQISQKEGCALFNQTDIPELTWQAKVSYDASDAAGGILITPKEQKFCAYQDGGQWVHSDQKCVKDDSCANNPKSKICHDKNDANTILKVRRDRDCAEWLQCQSTSWVWDAKAAKFKAICNDIGRCDQLPGVAEQSNVTQCANWVDGQHEAANKVLDTKVYQTRDMTWKGREFTGYSIPNMYPAEELTQVNIADKGKKKEDLRMVKMIPCGNINCKTEGASTSVDCQNNNLGCGTNKTGVCINHKCVQSPFGSNQITVDAPTISCRAYPERDSPFPNTPAVKGAQIFSGANLCDQKNAPEGCECNYTKFTYGGAGARYADFQAPDLGLVKQNGEVIVGLPEGICQGSPVVEGKACSKNTDCQVVNLEGAVEEFGTCAKQSKKVGYLGWQGFCLDKDELQNINADPLKNPCFSWLPVDQPPGALDLYNQYQTAGFVPNNGDIKGRYYCLGARGNFDGTNKKNAYRKTIIQEEFFAMEPNQQNCTTELDATGKSIETCVTTSIQQPTYVTKDLLDMELYLEDIDRLLINIKDENNNVNNSINDGEYSIRNGLKDNPHPPTPITTSYGNQSCQMQSSGEKCDPEEEKNINDISQAITTMKEMKDGRIIMKFLHDDQQESDGTKRNYIKENLGFFIKSTNKTIDAGDDLGTADNVTDLCNNGGEDQQDIYEIIFEFAKQSHQLQKMYLAMCSADPNDFVDINQKIKLIIKADLREWCPYVADVGDAGEGAGWTDRLWSAKAPSYQLDVQTGYTYTTTAKPFGSIDIGPEPSKATDSMIYAPRQKYKSGAPFSCPNYWDWTICGKPTDDPDTTFQEKGLASNVLSNLIKHGKERLSKIFAKAVKVLKWDWSLAKYNLDQNNTFNVTDVGDSQIAPIPPKVLSLGKCYSGGKCEEDSEGVTVNRKSKAGDLVIGYDGFLKVSLKFYAYADKNQMPVRSMAVNWSDNSSKEPSTGYYKNHRGLTNQGKEICTQDEGSASNFGVTPQACDSAYFMYDHIYTCSGKEDDFWQETQGCPSGEFQQVYGGCCVFKPRVQVKDNWGWCNGICKGGKGGDGCYDTECDTSGTWTEFAGQILVAPKKK